MELIIAVSFLAGSIFMSLLVWLFLQGAHCNDDPLDEAEANIPRNYPDNCDYDSNISSGVLLPRRSFRESKPSGRKHFAED